MKHGQTITQTLKGRYFMVIDFHVHTFPEKIAERALKSLSEKSGTRYYVDGTLSCLRHSMIQAGVETSVILPVSTNESQYRAINDTAYRINERYPDTGILSFGGIHPKNTNYKEILRELKMHGVKGIKLHPVYQDSCFDSLENMRIVECACENDLIIVIHAGYDVGFPGADHALPKHILPVIEKIKPEKLVLAHMGGWGCWDEVMEMLAGSDVWFDTSFCITPLRDRTAEPLSAENASSLPKALYTDSDFAEKKTDSTINWNRTEKEQLSLAGFLKLVEKHGKERILFGSDSPWSSQAESIQYLRDSGLSGDILEAVLYENAEKLLG